MEKVYTYEEIEAIRDFLEERIKIKPQIGIICGSGLGALGDIVLNPTIFDYRDIPNFPVSTVEGHAGRLIFGQIGKIDAICMQGRFHYYEGYCLSTCTMPIRLMKLLGVSILVVSNAAGGINPQYTTGDVMLIKDHINLVGIAGINPLRGPNDDRFGPRFVAVNDAYDQEMIQEAKLLANYLGFSWFQEGVYSCVGGPNYETVAEVKMLRRLGVDAVGMSTVHEVIVAQHCGLKCFGFSLITNEGVAEYNTGVKPNHEEILEVINERGVDLSNFVGELIPRLAAIGNNRENRRG